MGNITSVLLDRLIASENRLARLEVQEQHIDASLIDHGALSGLGDDDHSQYALLSGRSGGQTLIGGTAANEDLTLKGTSHATKDTSYVLLQPEGGNVGIGTTTPSEKLDLGTGKLKTVETSVTETYLENTGLRMKNIYTGAGWSRALLTYENTGGTDYFSIGALGDGQTFTYAYIGPAYNTPWMAFRDNKVGINTTAPPLRLSILSASITNNYSTPLIMLGDNRVDYYASIDSVRGSASTFMGLAFSTANNATPAEVMRIQWDGTVGIGTTAPGAKLELNIPNDLRPGGAAARSNLLRFQGGQGSYIWGQRWNFDVMGYSNLNDSRLVIGAGDNSSGSYSTTDLVTILSSGKVGIGETAPDDFLEISGALSGYGLHLDSTNGAAINIDRATTSNYYGVYLTTAGTVQWHIGNASAGNENLSVYDGIAGTSVMTIEDGSSANSLYVRTAGRVGIGTNSPSQALEVAGSVLLNNNNYYHVKNTSGTAVRLIGLTSGNDVFMGAIDNAGGSVHIREDGVTQISIVSGYVGIGTAAPDAKLHVSGDAMVSNGNYYYTKNSGGTSIPLAGITGNDVYLGAVSNAGGKVVIREDGSDVITIHGQSVGINTGSPDARLDVQVNSGQSLNCIEVKQEDTNRAFINFASTDVGSADTHLVNTAAVGTYYGKIKVAVNGTYRYIPVYNS